MKLEVDNREDPFFRLSNVHDLILFLIQQELRGTKFIKELGCLGFDGSVFSSELGVVILTLVGFTDRTDELWTWYYDTLDSFADRVRLEVYECSSDLAMEFYVELQGKCKDGKN